MVVIVLGNAAGRGDLSVVSKRQWEGSALLHFCKRRNEGGVAARGVRASGRAQQGRVKVQ